ncbi:MAG TPA: NUDIX hydrolase [Pyrinomonadaceae bacterium]|nr:NUDIX hydrolase [Pyrinomonadaceae bacterium]
METRKQVSAGGAAFRETDGRLEVALVLMIPEMRWQLPKGIIDPGETPEQAALREVREEAGIECELIEPIETIEYWFVDSRSGTQVRIHKFVHFYLMRYVSGDVADHDHEVAEARWFPVDEAISTLAFDSEKSVVILGRDAMTRRE